ncbi:hypothetical protein BRAO375_1040011 [Bradyrhizobium sp. ORS 375]|nr:hypothetical protein BRAO375_1040011 [Bradyrhizobium sp. ORS 375]
MVHTDLRGSTSHGLLAKPQLTPSAEIGAVMQVKAANVLNEERRKAVVSGQVFALSTPRQLTATALSAHSAVVPANAGARTPQQMWGTKGLVTAGLGRYYGLWLWVPAFAGTTAWVMQAAGQNSSIVSVQQERRFSLRTPGRAGSARRASAGGRIRR